MSVLRPGLVRLSVFLGCVLMVFSVSTASAISCYGWLHVIRGTSILTVASSISRSVLNSSEPVLRHTALNTHESTLAC